MLLFFCNICAILLKKNCATELHNTKLNTIFHFVAVSQSLAGIHLRVTHCGAVNGLHSSYSVSEHHSKAVTDNGAHHVPDPQDDGSCADMATQAAAGGEPAVPRGNHLIVPVYHRRWRAERR